MYGLPGHKLVQFYIGYNAYLAALGVRIYIMYIIADRLLNFDETLRVSRVSKSGNPETADLPPIYP